jgi:hypothetical protein
LLEQAYPLGESLGVAVWTQAEAGPFPCKPGAGQHWHEPEQPLRQSPDYIRHGTANLLVLFHPATGAVRAQGVRQCPHTVLPPWLKAQFSAILTPLPPPAAVEAGLNQELWPRWQVGLQCRITLPQELPPLRRLGVRDT